jgi:hypothetical protein
LARELLVVGEAATTFFIVSTPFVPGKLASVRYSEPDRKNEYFFTNLLTEKRTCGMIGEAWI